MHKYIRTMTVLAMSAISIFYLSGFFFFFLPLGWLLPNDKKTVEELEQKKDWAGLLGLSEIRIKNSPDESGWYYIRGLALQRMDKCTEAIPAYDLAIEKKNGDYDDAITNKALCQAEIREVDSAIQTLTMAIGRHPENWRHYYNMSYFYVKKEDSDKARIYLEQLRTRNLVVAKQLEENQIQPMERRLINEKKAAEAAAKYRQDREKLEREKTEREQQVREAEAFKMRSASLAAPVMAGLFLGCHASSQISNPRVKPLKASVKSPNWQ